MSLPKFHFGLTVGRATLDSWPAPFAHEPSAGPISPVTTTRGQLTRTRLRIHGSPSLQRALILVALGALAILMTFVFGWNLPLAARVDLRPGQVAPFEVVAPRQFTFVSALVTEQARMRAANAIPDQYDTAAGAVRREQVQRARALMGEIGAIRDDEARTPADKVTALLNLQDLLLSSESAQRLLDLTPAEWAQVAVETPQAVDRLLRDEIRPEDLATAQRRVPSTLGTDLSEIAAASAADLVRPLILPNSFLNAERTLEMRERASDDVSPQSVTVEQGETILPRRRHRLTRGC